jgi:hypothetical protein
MRMRAKISRFRLRGNVHGLYDLLNTPLNLIVARFRRVAGKRMRAGDCDASWGKMEGRWAINSVSPERGLCQGNFQRRPDLWLTPNTKS